MTEVFPVQRIMHKHIGFKGPTILYVNFTNFGHKPLMDEQQRNSISKILRPRAVQNIKYGQKYQKYGAPEWSKTVNKVRNIKNRARPSGPKHRRPQAWNNWAGLVFFIIIFMTFFIVRIQKFSDLNSDFWSLLKVKQL